MPDTRLTGLIRRLHTTLVPAAVGQGDRDALRAFIDHKDQSSFAAIVQRHGPMVLRVCQRVLHHTQDAEDAFQATFLVLARKAAAIGKADSLASWLHGVAYRVSMRVRRDAARRRAHERRAPAELRPGPTEVKDWSEIQALLEAEIERLPAHYRSAFVLCHLEGRTRAEAAAELSIEENTLSSRLARARARLQKQLARRGVSLSAVLAAIALTADPLEATIPFPLVESTARAAFLFAARQPMPGTSGITIQLANGAMQAMTTAKTKLVFGILTVGATLAVGTWGVGQVPGGKPGSAEPPGGPAAEPQVKKHPTAQRTADYAQRQRCLKNLKQIMLAMHNYLDTYVQFPANVTDKDGKTLLSWRVQLLPFLDQEALYKQFNLNEPWDSEHNLRLLAKMPDVYRVGFEPKDATHTYYQRFAIVMDAGGNVPGATGGGGVGGRPGPIGAPVGPGAGGPGIGGPPPGVGGGAPPMGLGPPPGPGLPGAANVGQASAPRFPLRMSEITDGTSNTLGVIEAGPPVPWTKPADIIYDARKPLPRLAGPFANVRNAATLDGAAYGLKPDLDETTLRRLIEPNDGNPLPMVKSLRAKFHAETAEEKKAIAKMLDENQALIAELKKQLSEHAALLARGGKQAKDMDEAEAQRDRLQEMLARLKAMNKELRGERPVPKK